LKNRAESQAARDQIKSRSPARCR